MQRLSRALGEALIECVWLCMPLAWAVRHWSLGAWDPVQRGPLLSSSRRSRRHSLLARLRFALLLVPPPCRFCLFLLVEVLLACCRRGWVQGCLQYWPGVAL